MGANAPRDIVQLEVTYVSGVYLLDHEQLVWRKRWYTHRLKIIFPTFWIDEAKICHRILNQMPFARSVHKQVGSATSNVLQGSKEDNLS